MDSDTKNPPFPGLEDWQHWTWVMGRAQQMLMEAWADSLKKRRAVARLDRRPPRPTRWRG